MQEVYYIEEKNILEGKVIYTVCIDFAHPVFNGHFPNNPILPGVMMCDIIRHLVSDHLGSKVQLTLGKNIKFSKMIVPSSNNTYQIEISILDIQNEFEVRAMIYQDENVYFKINARYKTK